VRAHKWRGDARTRAGARRGGRRPLCVIIIAPQRPSGCAAYCGLPLPSRPGGYFQASLRTSLADRVAGY